MSPSALRFKAKAREARLRTLAEGGRTSAEAEARAEAEAERKAEREAWAEAERKARAAGGAR